MRWDKNRSERGGVMIVIIVILTVIVVGFACANIVVVGRLQDLEAKRAALQEQITVVEDERIDVPTPAG